MKKIFIFSLSLFIFIACQESNTKPKEKSSEWTYLFDGTTLDGWKAYNEETLPQDGLL